MGTTRRGQNRQRAEQKKIVEFQREMKKARQAAAKDASAAQGTDPLPKKANGATPTGLRPIRPKGRSPSKGGSPDGPRIRDSDSGEDTDRHRRTEKDSERDESEEARGGG